MHSTDNLEDGYIGSGKRLWRSIRKHGLDNHVKEILEFLPNRSSLKSREKEIVNEQFLENPMCMNLQIGGGGGWSSEEHQLKCSREGGKIHSNKLKNNNEYRDAVICNSRKNMLNLHKEGKLKNSKRFLGKCHSEETKLKIGKTNSEKQSGNGNSQYGTCWITNGLKNKKIKKNDELPNDWSYGRKIKMSR